MERDTKLIVGGGLIIGFTFSLVFGIALKPSDAGEVVYGAFFPGVFVSFVAMVAIMIGMVLYSACREVYLRSRHGRAARRGDLAAAEIIETRWGGEQE